MVPKETPAFYTV